MLPISRSLELERYSRAGDSRRSKRKRLVWHHPRSAASSEIEKAERLATGYCSRRQRKFPRLGVLIFRSAAATSRRNLEAFRGLSESPVPQRSPAPLSPPRAAMPALPWLAPCLRWQADHPR